MNNEIKIWGEKFIVLMVVFLLIFPFDLPAKKQKEGARLKVYKKDGEIIIGELLQIKEKSLLLMTNSETGVTVDINEVRKIIIIKKSKALIGALMGVVGGTLGLLMITKDGNDTTGARGAICLIYGGIPGLVLGAFVGAVASTDKTFWAEGESQEEIDSIMIKLKKKARIKY